MLTLGEMEDIIEKGEEWFKESKKPQIGRDEYPTKEEPERLTETVDRLTERNQRLEEKMELLEELVKISPSEGKTTFKLPFLLANNWRIYRFPTHPA